MSGTGAMGSAMPVADPRPTCSPALDVDVILLRGPLGSHGDSSLVLLESWTRIATIWSHV